MQRNRDGGREDEEPSGTGPDEVADALLRASRVLVAVAVRSLQASGEPVTLSQLRMLVVLDTRGETNLRGLAADLEVTPSTALRMVDRLLRADLVERRADPDDRRAVLLSATSEGRALVRRVSVRRRRELARILERVPVEGQPALVAALEAFSEAAGEPAVREDVWRGLG